MARTNGTGSQRPRAAKHSTTAFAIATRTGVCETSGGRRDGSIRWILGSGYHRNAANNLSVCFAECDRVVARTPASERPLFGISFKPTRLLAPITILDGVRKQTPRARQRGWLFRWAVVFGPSSNGLLRRSGVCDCPQLRLRRPTQPRPRTARGRRRSRREIAATLAEQGHVTANLKPYALTAVALTIDQANGKRRRAA